MNNKEEINQKIKAKMSLIRAKYLEDATSISDRDLGQLSLLFYDRDKESETDIEMMHVQRGINQGLLLFRQIIEGVNL